MKKNPLHYVDNEQFLVSINEYQIAVKFSKENNEPEPPIPEYLGECFMKIANRLSFRPNFINYAFRDDMISEGIENCIQYMNNFNPEKSSNPFAYFTQIIYYAFVRRIQKEKKQLYIKYKTMDTQSIMQENHHVEDRDLGENYNYETMTNDQKINMYNFIDNFEKNKKKKKIAAKAKSNTSTLEMFIRY